MNRRFPTPINSIIKNFKSFFKTPYKAKQITQQPSRKVFLVENKHGISAGVLENEVFCLQTFHVETFENRFNLLCGDREMLFILFVLEFIDWENYSEEKIA